MTNNYQQNIDVNKRNSDQFTHTNKMLCSFASSVSFTTRAKFSALLLLAFFSAVAVKAQSTAPVFYVQPLQQVVCAGSPVTYTAGAYGAETYRWQFSLNGTTWNYLNPLYGNAVGSQTNTLTILDAQLLPVYQFRVRATGANGEFSYSNTVTNLVNALSLTSEVKNASCAGNTDGSIVLNTADMMTNYTFSWSHTSDNVSTVTNLAAGNYSVTVSDSVCSTTKYFTVASPNPLIAVASLKNAACNGSNGSAKVEASGGTAPYTYLWSNGATTTQIANLDTGTYNVTITDANGCSVSESVVIGEQATSGTITLDPSLPASGTNFISFANMAQALANCGVTGPVVINVAPGSGPFNEQLFLNEIPGASATNTITINGNGNTIYHCTSNTSNRELVRLNGTDHIIINDFVLDAPCANGWGVRLMNGNENVTISNNTINLSPAYSIFGANMQGIIASNSPGDPSGMAGALNGISILNNTINNGYNGIRINGNSANWANGVTISGNTLNATVMFGVFVSYVNDIKVEENMVNMKNVAMNQDQNSMGIYIVYAENGLSVHRNTIKNAGNQGLWLNYVNMASSTRGIVANNMIGGGFRVANLAVGIQLNFASYIDVYFNSVNVDFGATGIPFYVSNAHSNQLRVLNNSFAYTGSGAEARAMHASDPHTSFLQLDYNNYYSTGGRFVYFNRAFRTSLAALQTSNENGVIAHDENSISANPGYISTTDLHVISSSPLINSGIPLANVTTDIDGNNRFSEPAIGADEYVGQLLRQEQPETAVRVYPNPFHGTFKVDVAGLEGQVQLILTDMMGRQVYNNTTNASAGEVSVTPDVKLAQGVYVLQVANNGAVSQIRIVKQ